MSLTIAATKIEAFDTDTGTVDFTLESHDQGIHKLKLDTFVTLDGLGELFAAIRAGVAMMDREKIVDGAE
jgi:hypothetical protein